MPVHFAYSAEQGLRVYDSVELVYCEARISNLRDVQLRLLLGVPVTFGGVVIDCPAQRARVWRYGRTRGAGRAGVKRRGGKNEKYIYHSALLCFQ